MKDGYHQEWLTFCLRPEATFKIYIPTTAKGMERGLQRFRKLGTREGMLFPSSQWPKEEAIPMWQASVHYELAMVFLGVDGAVKFVEYVEPGDKRTFEHKALGCLEIPAEIGRELGIRKGVHWELGIRC